MEGKGGEKLKSIAGQTASELGQFCQPQLGRQGILETSLKLYVLQKIKC